jgi:GAF domain-containing protein
MLATVTSGLHSAFAFPVVCGPGVAGVMEFFSRDMQMVNDDLLELMTALCHQIGQFMGRMKAEQERQKSATDLQQALNNVKTLTGLLPLCSTCKKFAMAKVTGISSKTISALTRRR